MKKKACKKKAAPKRAVAKKAPARRRYADGGKVEKPKPGMLGTGMARNAAAALLGRNKALEDSINKATGYTPKKNGSARKR